MAASRLLLGDRVALMPHAKLLLAFTEFFDRLLGRDVPWSFVPQVKDKVTKLGEVAGLGVGAHGLTSLSLRGTALAPFNNTTAA